MSGSSDRLISALFLIGALSAGACAPTCPQACAKLDRCDLLGDVQIGECQAACEQQLVAVRSDDQDDAALKKPFEQHRRCIGSTSCGDLEAGECFDEDLFPY